MFMLVMLILAIIGEIIIIISPKMYMNALQTAREGTPFIEYSIIHKIRFICSLACNIAVVLMFFTGNILIGIGLLAITFISIVNLNKGLMTMRYVRFEAIIVIILLIIVLL